MLYSSEVSEYSDQSQQPIHNHQHCNMNKVHWNTHEKQTTTIIQLPVSHFPRPRTASYNCQSLIPLVHELHHTTASLSFPSSMNCIICSSAPSLSNLVPDRKNKSNLAIFTHRYIWHPVNNTYNYFTQYIALTVSSIIYDNQQFWHST